MGMYLDLDDLVFGHPTAQKELDELRQQLAEHKAIKDAAMNLCAVKGRYHSEQAMQALMLACAAKEKK